MNSKFVKNVLLYLVVIALGVFFINSLTPTAKNHTELQFSSFYKNVQEKKIESVTITADHAIVGKFKNGVEFSTYAPTDPKLVDTLLQNGVDVTAKPPEPPSFWMNLLLSLLPVMVLVVAWFFLLQQSQGGGGKMMNFGKSRAKMHGEGKVKVTFKDVAGADEAKEELAEVVDFLKAPEKYTAIGARIPKGTLLFGPPGTGKTLLARAVAGEAGVPFFTISGSDFVEMFVGVGASRVRDLFQQAKRNAPCIVFIDEIDAVGRHRGAGLGGGHDEREQTLNQLLVEMDGFGVNEGIITIAATNRPDILDPALLRPGRFDRQVTVGAPDLRGREAILKVHARNKPFDKDVDLNVIARKMPGATGADLANLINEAALLAARYNKKMIGMAELEEASEKVLMGPARKSHIVNEKERRLTAYHESGHAVIGYLLEDADPVHKVTVVPRGKAGGYTLSLPEEEINYQTRNQLLARLRVALGGRVAEEIFLGDISTGASSDLQSVTRIARAMVTRVAMCGDMPPIVYGEENEQVFLGRSFGHTQNYSEAYAERIDKEMERLANEALEDVRRMLTEHKAFVENMTQALLEHETIDGEQVDNLFKYGTIMNPNAPEPTEEESPIGEMAIEMPSVMGTEMQDAVKSETKSIWSQPTDSESSEKPEPPKSPWSNP